MIRPDLKYLCEFYKTALGAVLARGLRREVRDLFPEHVRNGKGLVLGIGYTLPYLKTFAGKRNFISLMPASQGATFWPKKMNRCFIAEEKKIPLPDCSVESVILTHELEFSENINNLLREIWRVLVPEGRVVILAPNRISLWAMAAGTPFGYGRPFSKAQIKKMLEESLFDLNEMRSLILTPPVKIRQLARIFRWVDKFAYKLSLNMGGIIMAVGVKRIYAKSSESKIIREPARQFSAPR